MSLDLFKKGFLTSNMLKVIAMVTMLIDHVGVHLFPTEISFRIVGRLAMPIFAYLIAEGCRYTKNKPRHFSEVFLLGAFCQTVMFIGGETKLNILMTFSVSILLIYITDIAMKDKRFLALPIVLVPLLYPTVTMILPRIGVAFDYGYFGIILPLLAFVPKKKILKVAAFAVGLVLLSRVSGKIQFYSLFALIPIFFYNGERGKFGFKYAFYIFYPLHLFVIFVIKYIMGMLS